MGRNVGTSFLPVVAGSPASPVDGQMWYDSLAAKAKVREAGATEDLVGGGAGGGGSVPPGVLAPFVGSSPPDNWLWANGQAVLRSQYPGLFARLGTTFGPGDGSSTFNLPDLRGRTPFGLDDMGGAGDAGRLSVANTLGGTGGTETVALTPAQTPLRAHTHSGTTAGQSVTHTHTGTTSDPDTNHTHSGTTGDIDRNHTHTTGAWLNADGGTRLINTTAGSNYAMSGSAGSGTSTVSQGHLHGFSTGTVSAWHKHSFTSAAASVDHTHSFTTGNPSVAEANGAAHDNMPPYLLTNWVISTGALYTPDPLMPALDNLVDIDLTGLIDGQTIIFDQATMSWIPGESAGVPDGGTVDQIITKVDSTDGNAVWSSYPVVRSSTEPTDDRVIWIDTSNTDDGTVVVANAGNIGDVQFWPYSTLPDGGEWIEAMGQQVTASYPKYRAFLVAQGSPHGTAGGNPLAPNMRGRVPVGQDAATFAAMGGTGGVESVTLTSAQSGSPAHVHSFTQKLGGSISTSVNSAGAYVIGSANTEDRVTAASAATDATSSHTNLQPYLVGKWIVRAGQSYTDGSGHRLVQSPTVVAAGQALVRMPDGSWVPEYMARQQDLDDLRQEFEEHHHDERYQTQLAGSITLPAWTTGTWTAPIVAVPGKSLLLEPAFSHADASTISQKSAGLASTNAAAAPDLVDCGGYAGWVGYGSGTGTLLPMKVVVVPAKNLVPGRTYYLNITAGAAGAYPLSGSMNAYWI